MLALGLLVTGNSSAQEDNSPGSYPKSFLSANSSSNWDWKDVNLANPAETKLRGNEGEMLNKGVARLALAPYETEWVLSDVSFAIKRIFTNYSGDISGRYLELAALTSPAGQMSPENFAPILKRITDYQKADGHFGVDVDLTKWITKDDPPMPMFWGNSRLLVGLVTASQIYHDERLMTSARKLGDFYVKSVELLCTPERIDELKATGTYGGSLTVCYFPAIESLAMLYRATGDGRYLKAARDIAEYFRQFDKLPTDHSHGSLCAYRGILMLYEITNESEYLKRAEAKWETAVSGGYVWPIGGVGEHWYVFMNADEGCSESDWLRFNLDLWHLTGRTRYLDLAERLLINEYPTDQCDNGGFGQRVFEGEKGVGPIAMKGVHELFFCCVFHGPLGLYYLKPYMATGGKETIRINLPLSFSAPVQAGGARWLVNANTTKDPVRMEWQTHIIVEPQDASAPVTISIHVPSWAGKVSVAGTKDGAVQQVNGYIKLATNCTKKTEFTVIMQGRVALEQRRFNIFKSVAGQMAVTHDITLLAGPEVLMAISSSKNRLTLLATVDAAGRLELLRDVKGGLVSPVLPGPDATEAQVHEALLKDRVVSLRPCGETETHRRTMFAYDMVIIPRNHLSSKDLLRFARRASNVADAPESPVYGEGLEKRSEAWVDPGNVWHYLSSGLEVLWGDIGMLEGGGYKDYRFEFDMTLPKSGYGVTSWVVRALSETNYLMFQIQSSDTRYKANQWITGPNSLRPHERHGNTWTALEPIELNIKILREKAYHVVTECRGELVTVWINGEKVYNHKYSGFSEGTVGFHSGTAPDRAGSSSEMGLFSNISLKKIE